MRTKGRTHYIAADLKRDRSFQARTLHMEALRRILILERSLASHAAFDRYLAQRGAA